MQLDTFLNALARREAQQAVLVSGQPMRVLIAGQWNSGAATPSDSLLETMLQGAAPGGDLRENSFETLAGMERFRVRVSTKNEARIIVLTRLDADGQLLAAEETAISAFAPQPAVSKPDDFDRARGAKPLSMAAPTPRSALPPLTETEMFPAPIVALPFGPPPVPGALTGQWYHAASGDKIGPISLQTMQQLIQTNVVRPDTMVWRQGMNDWAVAKLTDLSDLFPTAAPVAPRSPAPAQSNALDEQERKAAINQAVCGYGTCGGVIGWVLDFAGLHLGSIGLFSAVSCIGFFIGAFIGWLVASNAE